MTLGQLPNKLAHITKQKPGVYLVIAFALLALAGSVLAAQHYYSRNTSLPCTENTGNILDESRELYGSGNRGIISPDDQQELARLAARITQQPRHGRDINCQYILANHYLYEDLSEAESALAKAKSLAADGQTVSEELPGASIVRLEREIAVYTGARQDVINNTVPVPITEEDLE